MSSPEEFNLIHLDLSRGEGPGAPPAQISQLGSQLESLASAGRNLEANLVRERAYSRQLRDYVTALIERYNGLQKAEKDQSSQLVELRSTASEQGRRATELSSELNRTRTELTADVNKTRTELERYRTAWAEVLTREKRAQEIMSRWEAAQRRLHELETSLKSVDQKLQTERTNRERAEAHAVAHRTELQNVLVRLHSSEARFNDMTKELETLHSLRKNHSLEISKAEEAARAGVEAPLKARYQELTHALEAEREKVRTLTEESARLRDAIRREYEAAARREIDRVAAGLRSEHEARLAESRTQLEEKAHAELTQEIQAREKVVAAMGDTLKSVRAELSRCREELIAIEGHTRETEEELLNAKVELETRERTLSEQKAIFAEELETHAGRLEDQVLLTHAEAARGEALERELKLSRRSHASFLAECRLMQELLVGDKRRVRDLAERFLLEWDLAEGTEPFVQAVRDLCQRLVELAETPKLLGEAGEASVAPTGIPNSTLTC